MCTYIYPGSYHKKFAYTHTYIYIYKYINLCNQMSRYASYTFTYVYKITYLCSNIHAYRYEGVYEKRCVFNLYRNSYI
jgi:hypothetical protein